MTFASLVILCVEHDGGTIGIVSARPDTESLLKRESYLTHTTSTSMPLGKLVMVTVER